MQLIVWPPSHTKFAPYLSTAFLICAESALTSNFGHFFTTEENGHSGLAAVLVLLDVEALLAARAFLQV